MTKPIVRDPIYRRRVFDADIIQLCVRWYITYRLSYRDLVEWVAERGIPGGSLDDSTVGDPARAGIREALESILQARRHFLACG